jgi:hypothetical protein
MLRLYSATPVPPPALREPLFDTAGHHGQTKIEMLSGSARGS